MAKRKTSQKKSRKKKAKASSPQAQPEVFTVTTNEPVQPKAGDGSASTSKKPEPILEVEGHPIAGELPILPIRGTVVYPGTVMPLGIGRPSSRALLDECLPKSKVIGLVAQRDEDVEDPSSNDLYKVGAAAVVMKMIRQPDETVSIIVHGLARIAIDEYVQEKPYFRARVSSLLDQESSGKSHNAAIKQLREQAEELIEVTPNVPEQARTALMNIETPGNLSDFLAANLTIDLEAKQDLLEETDVAKRVRSVLQAVSSQLEIARLQAKIQEDVESSIGQTQKRIYLREQMKAIRKELGEGDDPETQTITQLRERIEKAAPPEAVMKEANRDLSRLESIPPASPEYSQLLTYLELIAELPWQEASEDQLDLDRAREILDRDHFGLQKVKRRLIEYLSVRKLNPQGRGPILCLVGPPGVGKTSLGQSVADALGREFTRLSLGGIRDEAEIRGHRRTYIGAMPGRIIQEIRRCGKNNPVMMLDELDKLGSDFRGDPASALLEVLDPRQNSTFVDRYLDVAFDLSNVIFIATANYMGTVPAALADRMEVIEIPGYTDHDKVQIARKYLAPRQLKENGLTRKQCKWLVSGIRKVINDYTREAGVRELERQIGAVCRHVASKVVDAQPKELNGKATPSKKKKSQKQKLKATTVNAEFVRESLGPEKYFRDLDLRMRVPGVVCGLAYTPVGGELLFIEAASYAGSGKVKVTGKLGDVMKESVETAMSLFKSRAGQWDYDLEQLSKLDMHIHVPAGAVPKDGPSAGVGMFTAMVSLLLNHKVKSYLAMTGEITLRGRVLPIGGVKEKTLAASRAGIRQVILPRYNEPDLEEIDAKVRDDLEFKLVETVDEVLEIAFENKL